MEHIICKTVDELSVVACALVKKHGKERVFLLRGAMGAGKTTFMQAIAKELQSKDIVSSPTFAIVNQYEIDRNNYIYHFDFYRINNLREAVDIGFEEYLYSGDYCFIEWAENVEELLPENAVNIFISVDENNIRTFSF